MNYRANTAALLLLLFLWTQSIPSQENGAPEDQLQRFHLMGFSVGHEARTLTENYQFDPVENRQELESIGLEYTTLIGSRLGFFSDLFLHIPVNGESPQGGVGDFTAGLGWNIWSGNWGLLPGIGFHTGVTYLGNDPFSEGEDTLYISFGLGGGCKVLYRWNNRFITYVGYLGNFDTLEFSANPRYRDRDNSFKNTYDMKVSLGAGLEI